MAGPALASNRPLCPRMLDTNSSVVRKDADEPNSSSCEADSTFSVRCSDSDRESDMEPTQEVSKEEKRDEVAPHLGSSEITKIVDGPPSEEPGQVKENSGDDDSTASPSNASAHDSQVQLTSTSETCRGSATEQQLRRAQRLLQRGMSSSGDKKEVGFSTITIREYPITVGDNPAGASGPPLTIEWKHQAEFVLDVDVYEEKRPQRRMNRQMVIPSQQREDMLKQAGFSRKEIVRLTKPVNVARAQRRYTHQTLGLSPVHELSQALSRTTLNVLTFGKRKRKEKKFLESWAQPQPSSRTRPEAESEDMSPSEEDNGLSSTVEWI